MKINIFYICTGKYSKFFENFYNSSEKFFLKNYEKHYTVFTDSNLFDRENISIVHQKKLGWPYDTMMRFHMFNSVEEKIKNFNFSFFFNANMQFVSDVGEETLPTEKNNYLVAVNHPLFYDKTNYNFPYERNAKSKFYIPYGEGKYYVQGCYNGGRTSEFMSMSNQLSKLIDEDLKNSITPIWHDESALNWYLKDLNPLILNPGYAYPESYFLPFAPLAVQLDKNKHGGHTYMRT